MKTLLLIILMSLMLSKKNHQVTITFMENQANTLINTEKMIVNEHSLVLIKNRLPLNSPYQNCMKTLLLIILMSLMVVILNILPRYGTIVIVLKCLGIHIIKIIILQTWPHCPFCFSQCTMLPLLMVSNSSMKSWSFCRGFYKIWQGCIKISKYVHWTHISKYIQDLIQWNIN